MFIVRYSEIGLKGPKARERMEQLLIRNIQKGLERVGARALIKRGFGRIFITEENDKESTSKVLQRTMGIKSFSPAQPFSFSNLEDIVSRSVDLWGSIVEGKSFAVRVRRNGQHSFHSSDVMRSVGDALYRVSPKVDLTNPDVELNIEIRDNTAYYYSRVIPGPGGLPLGSEGKLVALVSGGIDSPVAAWYVMKRGSPVDIIFVSLAPPVDTVDFLKAAAALISAWGHGYDPRIHILDGRSLVLDLSDRSKYRLTNVTYKRILYLAAQRIAMKIGAHGIVTGESLGQVSSQTPQSLHATSHGLEIPVMRPLLGLDKDEIVTVARKLGTFPETSSGEFCSLFSAHPITNPSIEELDADMENFTLLEELLDTDQVIRGSEVGKYLESLRNESVETEEIPEGARVVDLRSGEKYSQWHFPGAANIALSSLEQLLSGKDDGSPYVFYCMKGLQSAYAASKAREMGLRAYYISEQKLRKLEKSEVSTEK